eukprot:6190509-Pleurochrysis_carterae.AAC.2
MRDIGGLRVSVCFSKNIHTFDVSSGKAVICNSRKYEITYTEWVDPVIHRCNEKVESTAAPHIASRARDGAADTTG